MKIALLLGAAVIFILFWVWAFLDLVFSDFRKSRWKIAWLLVIIFFPIIGSILYFILRKDFQLKRRRTFQPYYRPGMRR